jgi:hypothetical protein
MYTLRFPFRLADGKNLGKLETPIEVEAGDLRLGLKFQSPYYVLTVTGFESEDRAMACLDPLLAGLFWAMLNDSLPFRAETELDDVYYPDDPELAATNLRQDMGLDIGGRVDGVIQGNRPAVYASELRMITMTAGDVSVEVGISPSNILASVREGILEIPSSALENERLTLALELYRSHFYEHSPAAKFITLVMTLESLALPTQKHAVALELLEDWKRQLNETRSRFEVDTDEYFALESLERELLFRREASIRSQIRTLVQAALEQAGAPDAEQFARRAVRIYDVRGALVHDGNVDPTELHHALRDANEIVTAVLKSILRASGMAGKGLG